MNFENLTEQQLRNLEEFMKVTMACDEEQLNAIDHQIPMTQELFQRCLDSLVRIHAVRQIDCLLQEYPDFTRKCGYDIDDASET